MPPSKKDQAGALLIGLVSLLTVAGGLGSTDIGHAPFIGPLFARFGFTGTTSSTAAVFGSLLAILSATRAVFAIWIAKGRRWAFGGVAILSLISMVLCLRHLEHHTGLIGLVLNPLIFGFCVARWRASARCTDREETDGL